VIGSITLKPKKAAVIIAATDELLTGAGSDAEKTLQTILGEAIGLMIDGILLGSTAATAASPGGILNGVSPLTATPGGGSAAVVADVRQLTAAIAPAIKPVFITGPVQSATLSLLLPMSNPNGFLVLTSPTLAAGTVVTIDSAAFASAVGVPSFRASQNVTLHEDTAATALSASGTPNVVAAPMRSAFQSDVTALRSIIPVDWALRRTGAVAYTTGTTW
jgi:Phage capsid family